MKYPVAHKREKELEIHGIIRQDEYRWLQDKTDPEVLAHIEKENEYVEDWMSDTKDLQETLYQEIRGRVVEEDESVRTRYKSHEYFTRTFEGKEYAAYYRVDDKGSEECLLDGNVEAEGKEYWDLGGFEISPSERYFAHGVDETGDEYYTLWVKDLGSGEVIAQVEQVVDRGLVFEYGEKALLFIRADEKHRPYRVCQYDLVSGEENVLYQEDDEKFSIDGVFLSRDERVVYVSINSHSTSDVLYRFYAQIDSNFERVLDRVPGHEYQLVWHDSQWLILSNWNQQSNSCVYSLSQGGVFPNDAHILVPESKEFSLSGINEYRDFVMIEKMGNATNALDILWIESGRIQCLEFDTTGCSLGLEEVNEYDSEVIRISYSDPIQPTQIWEVEVATGEKKLLKEYPVKGGFESSKYVVEKRWYTSHDGVKVPATVMYHKDTQLQDAPVYLYGYGSYGLSYMPSFSQARLSVVDRGVVFVLAHIRGGGDLGKYWHLDGRLLTKKNTFEDFIAVAQGLCDEGVTRPEKLVAHGGSAGGLLIGAVMNMRPDLFTGVIADVPFVDVINTMLDESLPLTITEYEEWGNPNEKEYYEYMASYAPYENIQTDVKYPVTLAIAGLNDPRVMCWEPAKWTARLRDRITNPEDVLCKIYTSGHSGTTGRFAYLREIVFRYAFVLKMLG